MNINQMQEKLENISGVSNVEQDSGTTRITSIDYEIFTLQRYTDTSNVVFDRWGEKFYGGLIRLPRIKKSKTTPEEIQTELLSYVPLFVESDVEIRVEPELNLDDDYYYLHIETDESIPNETITIVENIARNYDTNWAN